MGFAVLSLIIWGFNHHCWSKKSCCFKEHHNPSNIRIYWWMSFLGLCGILACCVSGFITSHYFQKKVSAIKCIYERIYYDSEYGELKAEDSKWKGLKKRNELIGKFHDFINNEYQFNFFFDKEWEKGNISLHLDKDVYYLKKFTEEIQKIFLECEGRILRKYDDSGELICDLNNYQNVDSILKKYIDEATRISRFYSDEVVNINKFINSKSKIGYNIEINRTNEILESISEDLNNYQTKFLDEVDYYINIAHICGYILIIIFYSIVIAIVVFCCFLLWAYTFFKEQKIVYILMHISWNILKFFSFSFFIFGAAFGILYLCSRDLIGYNQFLFSNSNLGKNETTYLLPNESAKDFLRYCINEDDSNYINNFHLETTKLIGSLYYNLKEVDKIKNGYNFSQMNYSVNCYTIVNNKIRNMQESDDTDGWVDIVNISFIESGNLLQKMINTIYDKLYQKSLITKRILSSGNIVNQIKILGNDIESLNCGFIKNELELLYDSLYELSIESRISCTLCCFIGFFAEISIAFYLLVIYHYNNNEFKDGNESHPQLTKNLKRTFDNESQNQILGKERPKNLKKNNKMLDNEYSIN